jgi:hypothetical protein
VADILKVLDTKPQIREAGITTLPTEARYGSLASFLVRSPVVCLSSDNGEIADIPQSLLGADFVAELA